jgi:polyketide cyclase/dehydrase/lipid transport protein
MALFAVSADTGLSPADAWARLVDWPAHGRYVPFTDIRVTTGPRNGAGTVFVARTGLGRFGFDDPMEVVSWHPPAGGRRGKARIEKRGRVMTGWAELIVEARGSGSRATWREDITVARLPRFADPGARLSSRLLFGRVLRKLLAG